MPKRYQRQLTTKELVKLNHSMSEPLIKIMRVMVLDEYSLITFLKSMSKLCYFDMRYSTPSLKTGVRNLLYHYDRRSISRTFTKKWTAALCRMYDQPIKPYLQVIDARQIGNFKQTKLANPNSKSLELSPEKKSIVLASRKPSEQVLKSLSFKVHNRKGIYKFMKTWVSLNQINIKILANQMGFSYGYFHLIPIEDKLPTIKDVLYQLNDFLIVKCPKSTIDTMIKRVSESRQQA